MDARLYLETKALCVKTVLDDNVVRRRHNLLLQQWQL